jgi:hypothetical protein
MPPKMKAQTQGLGSQISFATVARRLFARVSGLVRDHERKEEVMCLPPSVLGV